MPSFAVTSEVKLYGRTNTALKLDCATIARQSMLLQVQVQLYLYLGF